MDMEGDREEKGGKREEGGMRRMCRGEWREERGRRTGEERRRGIRKKDGRKGGGDVVRKEEGRRE